MIPRILDMLFLSAPHLAGDDVRQRSEERRRYRFYPRHPRGWRLAGDNDLNLFHNVSIHATLAGGDGESVPVLQVRRRFYPRHPRGWRHQYLDKPMQMSRFLSTPPSRVATGGRGGASQRLLGFYPRHPRGWRPLVAASASHHSMFLSTPPSRVATKENQILRWMNLQFLSTPPSRVATAKTRIQTTILLCFYPRHPRGWRQRSQGCSEAHHFWFLSTPPSRVATCGAIYGDSTDNVSIHATLAGGD